MKILIDTDAKTIQVTEGTTWGDLKNELGRLFPDLDWMVYKISASLKTD